MHRPVEPRRVHRRALLALGLLTAASIGTLRSFSTAEARSTDDRSAPQKKSAAHKTTAKSPKPAKSIVAKSAMPTAAVVAHAQEPDGKTVYSTTCAACHQATGEGVEGTYPPLAGSEWVNGDEAKVVRIVLHGLTGPVEVAGETYSGMMPPWGGVLKDADIAAVLTYVRGTWGNKAAPITAAKVAAIRAATASRTAPFTAPDLAAVK